MRAFLCAIDESVWDSIENGYIKTMTPKSQWDKAALALASANSKAINTRLYGVSTDEFHRILHVEIAKEAWTILETTYKGTKKVKDTKRQMLTLDLKSSRWVMMSHLIRSMGSSMKL